MKAWNSLYMQQSRAIAFERSGTEWFVDQALRFALSLNEWTVFIKCFKWIDGLCLKIKVPLCARWFSQTLQIQYLATSVTAADLKKWEAVLV
jgi:hypothetical protein